MCTCMCGALCIIIFVYINFPVFSSKGYNISTDLLLEWKPSDNIETDQLHIITFLKEQQVIFCQKWFLATTTTKKHPLFFCQKMI